MEEIQLERSDKLADMLFKDPNSKKEESKSKISTDLKEKKKKNELKDIYLRPNKN